MLTATTTGLRRVTCVALTRSSPSAAASVMMAGTRSTTMPQPCIVRSRGYHENVIDHYENPRNVGSLDKNDDDVGTVSLCGAAFQLSIFNVI